MKYLLLLFSLLMVPTSYAASVAELLADGNPVSATAITPTAGKLWATTGTAFSATSTPTLGASGTLGTLTFGNATSGTILLTPTTGALGTVTLTMPATSGTIALTGSLNAATSTIVNDTTTNATMYPVWVTANTGNLPLKVTSSKLSFNPSTGILTTDNLAAGSVAANTGSFASVAVNSVVFSDSVAGLITMAPVLGGVTSYTLTLPPAVGANNTFLKTDASGTTTWSQVPISTSVSGLGTGVATALGVNNNAAGGFSPIDGTATLTNKRVTPRLTTITSNATPTVNTDNCDTVRITALAAAITSMTSNLSGTPTAMQTLRYEVLDDGTARAITWGASFASGPGTLPTTTTVNKILYVAFFWSSARSKFICAAAGSEQ